MKQLYLCLACLICWVGAHAEGSPKANTAAINTTGSISLKFNHLFAGADQTDSVLVIFDRYDHTGAGVIYQVFYADQENNITIPAVPAGKYYVTIQCLGLHRDRLEKVVTIKSRKNEQVKIALQDSEWFSKDKVVIPASSFNSTDLAILRHK